MSQDTSRGVQTEKGSYGFYRLPKSKKDWRYIHSILCLHEIEDLVSRGLEKELLLCAYSNRVASGKKNDLLRMKYKGGFDHINFKHYDSSQKKRWIPDEKWSAGIELGHEPSQTEIATYILKHPVYSDSWRVFYAHKYPEFVKAKYSHEELRENLPKLLKKEREYTKRIEETFKEGILEGHVAA